jgi:hypothetical protein
MTCSTSSPAINSNESNTCITVRVAVNCRIAALLFVRL